MRHARLGSLIRGLRASARDTWLLIRQFTWHLFFLIVTVVGGGLFYFLLSAYD